MRMSWRRSSRTSRQGWDGADSLCMSLEGYRRAGAGSDPDAGDNQRKSKNMKSRQLLVQQHTAKDRRVKRNEMHERSGAIGADQLDAAIPCGKCEHAGENANVDYGENGQPGRLERDARGHFPDHERQCRERWTAPKTKMKLIQCIGGRLRR